MDAWRGVAVVALLTLVAACGGSSSGGSVTPVPQPPPFTSVQQIRVSQPSTFSAGCDGVAPSGTLYTNTAVEPSLAASPFNPMNLIAAWQQNRWSNGGAQGLILASSLDGGSSWTLTSAPFSRCTGGNSGNLGDYARATDPWLTVSPNGHVYALSLSFTGATLAPGSSSAMLAARSTDSFGVTWQLPHALIQDGAQVFNDKGSITADPINSSYVYAVWDRLTSQTAGPTYFAVTADGGSTWQPARSIYDPGPSAQTIGNQIVVLPGDVLLNVLTEIDTGTGGAVSSLVRVIRSTNNGTTWSAPLTIAKLQAVGTSNPANGAPVRDGSGIVSVSATQNTVYVAWQDSSFSMGKRDGIALVSSTDGGQTWSAPVQINADPNVQAFTPTVNVRADGVIAVTYFDLRNNTAPSDTHLYTDCWMVTSTDGGISFSEQHLSGSFDLENAPDAEGLFLGDYQALVSTGSGSAFLPFYAQPALGSAVQTDAFISFPPSPAAAAAALTYPARAAAAGAELTPEARQRVMARLRLVQAQRLRGR